MQNPAVTAVGRLLRSPRLALGVLGFLALYCGAAAWLPWQKPGADLAPRWAAALHLDRPFSSPAFLAATGVLFLSTAVCTWDRTVRVAALFRGRIRPWGFPLPESPGADAGAFLGDQGFGPPRADGVRFRFRPAIWGGWLLHMGLLAMVAGVIVQQGFHDGGAFELAEGESVRLDAARVVFGRDRGPFASEAPPPVKIGLVAFDPFLHQKGFAPDRASVLEIEREGHAPARAPMDRAAGVEAGSLTIFQAIPSGLALVVELSGGGARALHLREETHTRFAGTFDAPSGNPVRIVVESERHVDDPGGTGPLSIFAETAFERTRLAPGRTFDFGGASARAGPVVRWGGFTYSVDPGMPAVFGGFAFLLLGAALMSFPAGVAQTTGECGEAAGWVWVSRGREAILADWTRAGAGPGFRNRGGT